MGGGLSENKKKMQTSFMDGPISPEDSERNQEESSSLFSFLIVGIILAVLFGLVDHQRKLKRERQKNSLKRH